MEPCYAIWEEKKLRFFHVNESQSASFNQTDTERLTQGHPLHTNTRSVWGMNKSKYKLMEAATEAKSNAHHICRMGLRCELKGGQFTIFSVPAGLSCSQ